MPENYLTAILVLLFVVGMLLVYLLMESATDRARMWKDAYYNEVARHDLTRDILADVKAEVAFNQDDYARNLRALETAHKELQAAFLEQGRQITLAEGLARAADRMNA